MNTAADLAWLALCAVWFLGTISNKRDERRLSSRNIGLHMLILGASFAVLAIPALRRGPLGWRVVPYSGWIGDLGDCLQLAGCAFAIWARVYIGRNWSGTVTLKEGHALVLDGPYRIVRHPIYSGLSLAILGRAMENGVLGGFVAFLALFFEWKRKSLLEERWMVERFGEEYRRYRERVKGLIPGIW